MPTEYSIVVTPAEIPVIIPVGVIAATVGLLLVQMPPGKVVDSVMVAPTHTTDGPLIGGLVAVTVIILTEEHTVPKV
mgnify:CR=1 FL=1